MDKELQTIFEGLDKEIFTPELQASLISVVSEAVDQKVKEQIELEITQIDESYAEKLKTILEGMNSTFEKYKNDVDEDHTQKILQIKKALDESYGKKLLQVKEIYENVIRKQAVEHRDQLVEAVSQHLDICLEKAIPQKVVEEAAKNTFVQKQLNEARKVLGVDKAYISENLKQGVIQGKQVVEKLVKENAELKKAQAINESQRLLAESTANLPTEQQRFVRQKLEGKTPDFIKRNISHVLEMFARQEKTEKTALLNENKNTFIVDRAQVVADETRKTETLVENVESPRMAEYLNIMGHRK